MKYFVHLQDANHGPFTREQLEAWRAEGRVVADTPCIEEGAAEWRTVGVVLGPPAVLPPPPPDNDLPPVLGATEVFAGHQFMARRNWSETLATGCMFHVYAGGETPVLYVRQSMEELKTIFHFCLDAQLQQPLVEVRAQQVITFGGDFVVLADGLHLGTLRREGMASVMRDEWTFVSPQGLEQGKLLEDSGGQALMRRFNTAARVLMVQKYHGTINGQPVCFFERDINAFASKITLDFSMGPDGLLDRRLGVVLGVMMLAIEGK